MDELYNIFKFHFNLKTVIIVIFLTKQDLNNNIVKAFLCFA